MSLKPFLIFMKLGEILCGIGFFGLGMILTMGATGNDAAAGICLMCLAFILLGFGLEDDRYKDDNDDEEYY